MKALDLTGKTFGEWFVVEQSAPVKRHTMWLCLCKCGNKKTVNGAHLTGGSSGSCGCKRYDISKQIRTTHGHAAGSATKTYLNWARAKARCGNKNDPRFHDWGGRGIKVCDAWAHSFEKFLEDMGECPLGHSLERIDVNGNYCPENCKWIPISDQAKNKRNTLWVQWNGERVTLADLARKLSLDYSRLRMLYRDHKIPIEIAVMGYHERMTPKTRAILQASLNEMNDLSSNKLAQAVVSVSPAF